MPSCTLGSSVVACIYRAAGKSLSLEGMSHTVIATGVQTFCSPEAEGKKVVSGWMSVHGFWSGVLV